ncbi:MAG: hypothetical protein LC803_23430 [Acidobacteria bacterium]|nr:hypothetical protein [Acidobacteriota bacterium]
MWTPIAFNTPQMSMRRSHFLQEIARLKPVVTLEQAESDVTMVARQLEKQCPETNTNFRLGLMLLPERLVGEMRLMLLLLAGAVGLVLLIAGRVRGELDACA